MESSADVIVRMILSHCSWVVALFLAAIWTSEYAPKCKRKVLVLISSGDSR
jgi:hypothetical protein